MLPWDAPMESLGEHPISGQPLAWVTSLLLQSSLSTAKMNGTPPPQLYALLVFLESSERCWQVPFCVIGRSRALGSEEGGKAMFPMADLWDDQELGKAR